MGLPPAVAQSTEVCDIWKFAHPGTSSQASYHISLSWFPLSFLFIAGLLNHGGSVQTPYLSDYLCFEFLASPPPTKLNGECFLSTFLLSSLMSIT